LSVRTTLLGGIPEIFMPTIDIGSVGSTVIPVLPARPSGS
jgi:hypothetical protein